MVSRCLATRKKGSVGASIISSLAILNSTRLASCNTASFSVSCEVTQVRKFLRQDLSTIKKVIYHPHNVPVVVIYISFEVS
ncbi:hypothetical protein DL95DRAFT_392789 [Leptodontidium sp. 2 PMI_412]|nr:hypothetical protein DL95DRAFT_392789 [Leptodontidium sp. 2 PMI_412]